VIPERDREQTCRGPSGHVAVDGGRSYETALLGNATGKEEVSMPSKRANVRNGKQYEALREKGHVQGACGQDRELARLLVAGAARSRDPAATSRQGGTTAQKKATGRKGGKAAAKKS
jgi:hypothetical protein